MLLFKTVINAALPAFFWYAAAGAIAALTLWVLIRHFVVKKGDCCGSPKGDCAGCPKCGSCDLKKRNGDPQKGS